MDKLTIETKSNGDSLYADEVNAIVSKINDLVDFRNLFSSDASSATADITNAIVIGMNEKYTYSGEKVVPNVSLYMNGGKLTYGTDYVTDVKNAEAIGTGTLYIYGLGAYSGTKTIDFAIEGAKYSLSYNIGSEHSSASVPSSRTVSVLSASDLPTLTDSGYSCSDWYYDAALTLKASAGDTLTATTVLYAKWIQNVFKITFNDNGHGTAPTAVSAAKMVDLTEDTYKLTADGYYFAGWYKEAACTNAAPDADTELTANITLYAKWISTDFCIVLDGTSCTLEKTATDALCTLEYSTDGSTWSTYTEAIALTSTTTIQARLKYDGTVIAGGAEAITATYDGDTNAITFASTAGNCIVTKDGSTESDGTIELDLITTSSNVSVTDGVNIATITITNT